MLSESQQQSLYKSIEKALLCVDNVGSKTELTHNQQDALNDAIAGLAMGKYAYYFWHKNWLDKSEEFGLTEDDVEYMLTVKFIVNWVEENYCE